MRNDLSDEYLQRLGIGFNQAIPHNVDVGVQAVHVSQGDVTSKLPYQPHFLADPVAGLINTGVVTSLADSSCGLAVYSAIGGGERIATLDLRIDYLRAALAGSDLYCRAICERETDCIVFVSAEVYQQEGLPVAKAQASFMRNGRSHRPVAV